MSLYYRASSAPLGSVVCHHYKWHTVSLDLDSLMRQCILHNLSAIVLILKNQFDDLIHVIIRYFTFILCFCNDSEDLFNLKIIWKQNIAVIINLNKIIDCISRKFHWNVGRKHTQCRKTFGSTNNPHHFHFRNSQVHFHCVGEIKKGKKERRSV